MMLWLFSCHWSQPGVPVCVDTSAPLCCIADVEDQHIFIFVLLDVGVVPSANREEWQLGVLQFNTVTAEFSKACLRGRE